MTSDARHITFSPADIVTVANGVCGFLALTVISRLWLVSPGPGLGHRELVACLLLYGISMVLDVLDGPIARRFGSSGLGSGLDTICDTISFGLLPAMLVLARLREHRGWTVAALVVAGAYVGAMILRLARQSWLERKHAEDSANERHSEQPDFTGMPSPAGGNCVLAVVVLAPPPLVCIGLVGLVAVLLVADFPYPTNKTALGGAYVALLLAASFAALAGLISLKIPSVAALVGLLPVAVFRASRRVIHGQ